MPARPDRIVDALDWDATPDWPSDEEPAPLAAEDMRLVTLCDDELRRLAMTRPGFRIRQKEE